MNQKNASPKQAEGTSAIDERSRVQKSLRPETPREAGFRPFAHWSGKEGLTELDPAFHGKGAAGQERAREQPPGVYFGYGDYKQESELGSNRYEGDMDFEQLYDLNKDPMDLFDLAKETFKARNNYRPSTPQVLSEMENQFRENLAAR